MRTRVKQQFMLLITILVLGLAACETTEAPAEVETVIATADISAISERVLAEVEAQLQAEAAEAVEPTPAATPVDAETIVETVLTRLAPELEPEEEIVPEVSNAALAMVGDSLQESLVQVYEQANPSVVFIIVPPGSSGSGFVYSADGYIVTNNHVVEAGRSYEVVFASGERQEAELVGSDVDSDLAVLQVKALPEEAAPLPLAQFETIQVGEFVVVIGNPFGEQGSMSLGIVSALGRSLDSQRDLGNRSSYSLPEVIQTDAPINPGNSGGPLLNLLGEVIGVNSAIVSTTGINSGVGFSIPVQAVERIVPSLIEEGSYVYPYMGVGFDEVVSLDEMEVYGLSQTQGAYVLSVTPDSPADEAGLIGASPNTGRGGDLVVAIDSRVVNDFSDLNGYLVFHTAAGQTVELSVLRDGELVMLPLTLGSRP
jgi:2-alkenal reductase